MASRRQARPASFRMLWILLACLPYPATAGEVLTIETCVALATRHNRALIAAESRVGEIEYERWALRSRFLPKVELTSRYNLPDRKALDLDPLRNEAMLTASQRLLEFGPDAQADVSYRSERRFVLGARDRALRRALSDVRRSFYLALQKDRQIASRREVLANDAEKHRRTRVKYERGVAKEFDLLTSQLDSLEQVGQINALQAERRRLVLNLLSLLGKPHEEEVLLTGQIVPFELPLGQAVELAVERDIEIGILKEEVEERSRELRETRFAYAPDAAFQIGVQRGDVATSLDLARSSQNGTWLVDLSSDVLLKRTGTMPLDGRFDTRQTNQFASFQVSLPVFEGLSRYGRTGASRERWRRASTDLDERRDRVGREVRVQYRFLEEARLQVEIDTRRLEIARRRLEIQERLRELGQVTDNQVETFRDRFFVEQERLFRTQDDYIKSIEDLRETIGYFD